MKFDTVTIRNFNTDLIRTAMKASETSTKNSLAKETGLSVASCKNILDDLLTTGEVIEIGLSAPAGGRPSRRFQYNFNYLYRLCIYIETDHDQEKIYYSIHNLMNQEIESNTLYHTVSKESITIIVVDILERYSNINTCIISIPGVVYNNEVLSCDIPQLKNSNLKGEIEDTTGILVEIENDVNTMAFGSLSYKNNHESLVHLYFPKGRHPGMGLIVNETVIRGVHNFAGEIKELPIQNANLTPILLQKNTTTFINYITDIVVSINSIINPSIISLTIPDFEDIDILSLKRKLLHIDYIGEIRFNSDIHDILIKGLLCLHEISERKHF